jgi:hypothetical protein
MLMNFILLTKTKILSIFINLISPTNLHNYSKFLQIKNIWTNIKLDKIDGDYIEFGIFKGKSLYHSYKTYKKIFQSNEINFYGLDSFDGFPIENHHFYRKENFKTSYEKVSRQFKKYRNIKIFKGFFEEVVSAKELEELKKISFAFIDCDIYESSQVAFKYLKPRMAQGGFIMIDDFTSIDENQNTIMKAFFEVFELNKEVHSYSQYSNGQVFRFIT